MMNTLSWALYLTGVIKSLGFALTMICVGTTIALGAQAAYWGLERGCDKDSRPRFGRWLGVIAITLAAGIFLPEPTTMKMIIASELGERAAKTEAVTELSKEAYETLRHVLRDLRKEKK